MRTPFPTRSLPARRARWRALLGAGACLVRLVAAAADPGGVPIEAGFLDALLEEARTNHPGLRAAARREHAARRTVDGVRLWEDPMVRVGKSVANTPGPDLEMEGDVSFEVQQMLPLFGKATAMKREAEAGVGVATAEAEMRFQFVRRDVVQAAYRLALADATRVIGADDVAALQRMTEFARERQGAGIDTTLDLLRLENERARREQQQVTDMRRREFEAATLSRLIGRPLTNDWPVLALPEVAPEVPLSDQLYGMSVRYEPRLKAMRKELEMAEAGVEVTRRSARPNVTAGIEARQWSGSGGIREGMVTVGLTVPWFNRGKYRADVDRDRARADAIRADAADYEFDVRREVFRVWTAVDAMRREAVLYRDTILPRSRLALDTAMAAWGTGRGMFLDVMDARRMWIEARLMLARAVTEQHVMIAELVTCCGVGELDSLSMLGIPPATGTPGAKPR